MLFSATSREGSTCITRPIAMKWERWITSVGLNFGHEVASAGRAKNTNMKSSTVGMQRKVLIVQHRLSPH
jgi:hypothetical protein